MPLCDISNILTHMRQVDHVTEFLRQHEEKNGLFALAFSLSTGKPHGNTFSVGARADSAYEYLLKEWLMTGRTEKKFLDMCKSPPERLHVLTN